LENNAMRRYPSDIAFTPAVKQIQVAKGSRAGYARVEWGQGWETDVTPELAEFLAGLDMFYFGTANSAGQPYIQYRGGSPGFLKVLDDHTLAFADFAGNRQYITLGNLSENPQAFIFLMDYPIGEGSSSGVTPRSSKTTPRYSMSSPTLTIPAMSSEPSCSPLKHGT
jgi:predicted pyridoxine 5'-phosphate oxidase superfamily flavin-nucleotide-binding protein